MIATASEASESDVVTFGLAISIVAPDGAPVRDDAWIDEQIRVANALYESAGVRFRWTLQKPLAKTRADVRTRDDRDAFASLTDDDVIDVFLVRSLEDVDEPGRMRKGVCWTSSPGKKRYIVLSAEAPSGVLAHELGHFFGNPHSPVPDNVMSYTRTGAPAFFDPLQLARIRSFAKRFLATKRLFDLGPARRRP
ncbi:hypothetical protein [Labilithrix luteola]|nr:hypothetical protein [Labilithrix luteola]